MIVYVVQRRRSSSRVIPDTVPEYREPVREEVRDDTQQYEAPEHDFDDDAFPHEGGEEEEIPTTDEEAEENVRTDLLESVFTEFTGWIRSTGGTGRLIGMTGRASSSNTRAENVSERGGSNWLVPIANIDVLGPLSWDEPSAANTDELHKGAIFRTKDDLALAVGLYHMQNRVEYAVYRWNKTRLVYMCKHERKCPFKLCAVVDGVVWRIYKFDGTHTCHMDISRVAPRQVPARVIAKYFARKLVDEGVVLKPKEMMRNPGTLYEFQTNTVHELKYTFLAPGPCISVFHAGARPVVVIDGTHLKGKNKGILFVAVTKDDNEQIEDLLIVSDQHKSIKNAVAVFFPRATHGLCYYHLQTKMAKRGSNVIGLFKDTAYAYRTDVFQRHLSALEMLSRPTYEKLCNIGDCLFAQCLSRSGKLWKSGLLSVGLQRRSHLWKVEVGMKSFMVDLHHRTCNYREFELDLIPCSHAAAAIRFSGGNIYEFVDRCYKTETIASMYDSVIMGLPSPEDWIVPSDGCPLVRAPVITKQAGHHRMSRARGGAEASSSQRRQICTRCHVPGHNRRVCTAPVPIVSVDLNAPPESAPPESARRRAPKKCGICGETTHTRPRCPSRQAEDLD
ncbi:hypothetical protein C2S52_007119 [Perilla frutescens var. hirtella]|nr:hypothetical protein C2S52_007119 [Perilla frutescens var. hirtella]